MSNEAIQNNERKMTSIFERFLSLWVILCIVAGILLGKIAPGVAQSLDGTVPRRHRRGEQRGDGGARPVAGAVGALEDEAVRRQSVDAR